MKNPKAGMLCACVKGLGLSHRNKEMTVPAVRCRRPPSRPSQQCFAVRTDEPAKRVKLAATWDDCVIGSTMEVCDDLLGYVRCSVVDGEH